MRLEGTGVMLWVYSHKFAIHVMVYALAALYPSPHPRLPELFQCTWDEGGGGNGWCVI